MVTAVLFNEPCFPFIAAPFMLDRECWAMRERKKPMLPAVTRLSPTETLDLQERTGTVPIAMTFVISDGGMAEPFKGWYHLESTASQLQSHSSQPCVQTFSRNAILSRFGFTNSTLETFSCANTDQCFREHRQVKTWKRNSLFKYLHSAHSSQFHDKCFDSRYYWINDRLIYAWSGDTQVASDTRADVLLHKLPNRVEKKIKKIIQRR